mgnify:CR=1 FL=1
MFRLCLVLYVAVSVSMVAEAQDPELTRGERNTLRAISDDLDRVERLIRQRRFDQAARSYQEANQKLGRAPADMSDGLRAELEKQRERLMGAHAELTKAEWTVPEPVAVPTAGGEPISFSKLVVPILVEKCGRCHVSAARGQFSMATFNALMASRHVDPGQPAASNLILVIETGDMPRGGGTVAAEELDLLRRWIAQGAKSDLDNNNQNLNEIARASVPAASEPAELMAERPTGTETVSFALDVAPVLIDSCSGCHLDAQQIRGGLNLTSFAGLLRGGDNGRALVPGRGADSLLVRKLRGMADGQRMPIGRPALATDVIDKIAKWIDEGARFDGGDPALPIRTVAARVRANSMTHEQLAADRAKLAASNWSVVMADRAPNSISKSEVFVLGSPDAQRLESLADLAEAVIQNVKGQFKLSQTEPLIKGKITLLVFEQRYDFNEYGVMLLGHPLPRDVKVVWRYDQVDARIAICLTPDFAGEALQVELARQVAAMYAATLAGDLPRWLADGIGYDTASRLYPRNEQVKTWSATAQQNVQGANFGELLRGQLAESRAAWIGYAVVTRLRSDASRFSRFWTALEKSGNFAESFQTIYQATWEQYLGVAR